MNLHDEIAKVAHEIFEKNGRIPGRDFENWLEAEKIVMARHKGETQSVAEKTAKAAPSKKAPEKAPAKKTAEKKTTVAEKKTAPAKAAAKKTAAKTTAKAKKTK